jgi:uncharacterized protein YeaO (DUF488 family)
MQPKISIKRVYERPAQKDGYRILVDRLWPRGVTKEDASIDEWAKELAPSVALRKWFGHDPELWADFKKMYIVELKKNKAIDVFVASHKDKNVITLVYAGKDEEHTHALVIQQFLEQAYSK